MFMKCVTDFSINEKNALAINHSKIKMDENYIKYENILKDSFVEGINNCIMKEKKPVENIFLTVKNLLSINDEYYKRIRELGYSSVEDVENSFNERRESQHNMMEMVLNVEDIQKEMQSIRSQFCKYLGE